MSYEKQVFVDGKVLNASDLNAMSEALHGLANTPALAFDGGYTDEGGYLHLTLGGGDIEGFEPFFVGGGTGGQGSYTYSVTVENMLESRVFTVPDGETVTLNFNYYSIDSDGIGDGPGIGQVSVGGIVKHIFSAVQGENSIDITKWLSPGSNTVSVRVTNSENVGKTLAYTITVAAISLSSSFDASVPYTGAINFVYTPTGVATKTVHFELDGAEIGTDIVTTSGRQVGYTIPAQAHGSHILRVWFTCDIEGSTIPSNVLYYSIICTTEGDTRPIIAVTTPPLTGVEQYSNIVMRYRVYSPASMTSAITLEANGETVSSLTVDRTEHTWTYRPDVVGDLTQTIRCGDAHVSWTQTVTESSIQVEAEKEALGLYLSSYGRSNNEANPGVWESNGVSAEFTNFNFVSDGWLQDEDNITVMRVTGDARLNIPYRMFAHDFRTTGKTMEFEFATREVLNYDAEIITCYSGDRGFKITAQQLLLKSEQSSIGTRYKEDEHIRVSFVVEKKSENRLILCYVNGIMSGAVQYPEDDDFSQTTPVGITIGSNDCTTDIYVIRAYDNSLTRHQILDNWIADTQNAIDRLTRYNRNDIYDVYGQVVVSKLPNDLPYLVPQGSELPQFKGDKKTINDYFIDPQAPARNYTSSDTQIDVQGTSSQYYYRKNYKQKYKNGFILFDGSKADTYQMNENAIPTDTFTMKADVASSEGAFNVVLSMLYNELCPYKTPAQEADSRVRQTIEGFPIVIFWDNGSETKFLGKYNFNNDKGTPEVFGFKPGDESWEILQNGTDRVGWHSADFSGDGWKTDFEARYPDKNTDITKLKALAEWLVSTDTAQATGEDITEVTYGDVTYTKDTPEYRLAKFSAELSDHFVEEAIIFYYLFTEMFLSIDQREKNAFPTYLADEDRWIVLFYDADSSCGTDNKGNLTFDYYLEDIDYTDSGDPVYNGQNSVLWKNLRETRHDEIMAMYQELRTGNKVSYESIIGKFENHQSKWPEAIFNEDMYTKCLEPLINDGDGLYLPMLQGKKEQWMKWWLYNRFRYLDSKYVTGSSMENRITIRAHQKANVKLTSYVNMYGHVYFNAAVAEHRMTRGQEYEFEWPASGAEDPVIGINDADLLTNLGDLSPLMVELIDVSGAPHISRLKLGDGASTYTNLSLNSVTLGNNKLLRHLDMRNCPNLTMTPDVSGCTNIEEIYCEGSAIAGIKLANGGILNTLHLPDTVVSLQIMNQPKLTDFSIPSYSQITTLRLENAGAASALALDILQAMPSNSRVRVLDIDYEAETSDEMDAFIAKLESMRGLDESGNNVADAQVSGRAHAAVISFMLYSKLASLAAKYPSLAITYDEVAPCQTHQLITRTLSGEYVNDRVTKVGTNAFVGTKLRSVYLPNAVTYTTTGYYNAAFGTMIEEVSLPEMTSMSGSAFYGCSKLKSVDLPKLKSVGVYMFTNVAVEKLVLPSCIHTEDTSFRSNQIRIIDFHQPCSIDVRGFTSNLQALILRSENLSTFRSSGFPAGPYVYVPASTLESYRSSTNASAIAEQFRALEDYTVDGTIMGDLDETKI